MSLSQDDIAALIDSEGGVEPSGEPSPEESASQAGAGGRLQAGNLPSLLRLPVTLKVELADRQMPLSSLLELNVGSIVEFTKMVEDDLTLVVANRQIGRGQAVKVGENFGIRITRIGTHPPPADSE